LFYYRQVSFVTGKVGEVQKNIARNLRRVKEEELSTVRQFEKCIFNKKACLI